MSTKAETAAELFLAGFNCAQSVIAAYCEEYDMDTETALKTASALGGGCGLAELCGAVSGGALVVGLKYGQYILEDTGANMNCRARRDEFLERFIEKYGSPTCRGLLGFDHTTEEGAEKYNQVFSDRASAPCVEFVRGAAQILEELGY